MSPMKKLKGIFTFLAERGPKVSSKVKGLKVSIEKKEAALSDGCADHYYEVTVSSTGENPDYPANEKLYRQRFTTAAKDGHGFAYISGNHIFSKDTQFKSFQLTEEHDNGRIESGIGRNMPPHHVATLRVYGRGKNMLVGVGFAVRKSEQETPQWKAALKGPIREVI